MSVPRQILPGRFFKITRRCTQRQFLLRPDDETNNAFVYCLAEAAARFGTEVIASSAQSNHHTDPFARDGRVVEFMEHFHKMMAKCMNALRGRWENFWSCEEASVVHLVDRSDVVDKVVYTLANPVKDGLVDTVAHWPGVNTLKNLLTGKPLRAQRPKHFFSEDGCARRQLDSPDVLPHQPLLPRCLNGIAPVDVAQFVVAAMDVGTVAAMSAVNTSLVAAARRHTFTRR